MQTGTKKTPDRFQNYFCPAAANDIVHHAYAWIAMDDYSGPETKEGLRGMYHSPQDVSAFSDPFRGSVSVTSTRDEKQEPAKSGLEAKRDACAISAAHLDSPNTEIPNGKNMERE